RAHLGGRVEAARGDLAFEVVELGGLQSARIALVVQSAEGVQAAALIEIQPVADGAWRNIEQERHLIAAVALVQPEEGSEAVMNPHVFLFAAKLFNLLPHQRLQSEFGGRVCHGSVSAAEGRSRFLLYTTIRRKKPKSGSIMTLTSSTVANNQAIGGDG